MALPPSEHVDIFNADSVMKYSGPSADPAFVRNSIVAAAKYRYVRSHTLLTEPVPSPSCFQNRHPFLPPRPHFWGG
jgi:hypothetical protein